MAAAIRAPAAVPVAGSPDNPDQADIDELCDVIRARLGALVVITPELDEALRLCVCDSIIKAGALTEEALDFLIERVLLCILHAPPRDGISTQDVQDALREAVETSRPVRARRRKGARGRGPRRARWPRTRKPRSQADYMQCGSKRSYRKHFITRAELVAWMHKNCQGKKPPKVAAKGGPVGGTLADARRAAGLWDWGQPIDEARPAGAAPLDIRAAEAAAAYVAADVARGGAGLDPSRLPTLRASDLRPASFLGFKCQAGSSTITCDDPGTGLSRSWAIVGRNFTKAEQQTFREEQCTPTCSTVPIDRGAPAGATTKVRRVAPRNPAVKPRIQCGQVGALPMIAPLALRPLPKLGANPAEQYTAPGCVKDVIVGGDCGIFASNWYIVLRGGVRMLVPNPEGCGMPVAQVCFAPR